MKGDEEKALSAGCDGYLTKPIDTRTLPKMLASLLGDASVGKDQR
jgi:CheY-like chemotaxis protein